mmetsp:Transcript_20058/g.27653  ORF Transcript_20058/g.27653 Transcript_20058/m.27653 type:complete len:200 (+) Transcript_20058:296-895(+)
MVQESIMVTARLTTGLGFTPIRSRSLNTCPDPGLEGDPSVSLLRCCSPSDEGSGSEALSSPAPSSRSPSSSSPSNSVTAASFFSSCTHLVCLSARRLLREAFSACSSSSRVCLRSSSWLRCCACCCESRSSRSSRASSSTDSSEGSRACGSPEPSRCEPSCSFITVGHDWEVGGGNRCLRADSACARNFSSNADTCEAY